MNKFVLCFIKYTSIYFLRSERCLSVSRLSCLLQNNIYWSDVFSDLIFYSHVTLLYLDVINIKMADVELKLRQRGRTSNLFFVAKFVFVSLNQNNIRYNVMNNFL